MMAQCSVCGKVVRASGIFSGWHLCLTEEERAKHGTYCQAKAAGRVRQWAEAINADIDKGRT